MHLLNLLTLAHDGGKNGPRNRKIFVSIAAQWLGPFSKFATVLQQQRQKAPENTPNYGKTGGAELPEDGYKNSLKALRL